MVDIKMLVLLLATVVASRDGNRLFEDLLRDYDRLVRPVRHPKEPVVIKFKFKLLQILDLYEKGQVLRTSGLLQHVWVDYRLQWRPREYANITKMQIPGTRIWLPDIILYNNADGRPTPSIITKATIFSNGTIVWTPPAHYSSLCVIDTKWFPYDEQLCELKFGYCKKNSTKLKACRSWTYSGEELEMVHPEPDDLIENITLPDGSPELKVDVGIDISEYQESVEFDLLSIVGRRHEKYYPCCDFMAVDIVYDVIIRRKKLFYTVNLMIPCIGIATLASFVFYLPSESHNKITLSVSVLVSLTVFFLLLIEIIPPTSIETPLIANNLLSTFRYLLFTMFMVSLSVILTVGILNIHHQRLRPMPSCLRWFIIDFLGYYLLIYKRPSQLGKSKKRMPALNALRVLDGHFKRKERGNDRQIHCATISYPLFNQSSRTSTPTNKAERQFTRLVRRTIENICYIQQDIQRQKAEEDIRSDWRFMAMIVDRLFALRFFDRHSLRHFGRHSIGTEHPRRLDTNHRLFSRRHRLRLVRKSMNTQLLLRRLYCLKGGLKNNNIIKKRVNS
ncbi:Acr-6 [Aphelenchoides besseyi]|nr:Acr-6 [Aphelenchoides besseyi]